jgi:hypothetical protein
MAAWKTTLRVRPEAVKLLVRAEEGDDLLKAQLPAYCKHPRALLTLLEGLALWCGTTPLCVAIAAEVPVSHSLGLGPFSDLDDGWPASSPLVRFDFDVPPPRGRRIRANFRPLEPLSPGRRAL